MNDQDRALVDKFSGSPSRRDQAMARIIRELEAELDAAVREQGAIAQQDASIIESLARRWRHAGRTIRRLRRRWKWERRRAEKWRQYESEGYEVAVVLRQERDALRARCERLERERQP